MSYTQADVEAMDRAIASGLLEIRKDGRVLKYRTLEEMMRARQFMVASVNSARRPNRVFTSYNRGLAK